jgi:CxxC-x17-CxxC domain-containing protein
MPEFQDRVLKCADCGTDFVFTAGEQQFYYQKEFKNEPKRCRQCKSQRQNGGERAAGPGRVETAAVCSQCGRETTVPFRPTQGRPVFCRQCFQGRKTAAGAAAG